MRKYLWIKIIKSRGWFALTMKLPMTGHLKEANILVYAGVFFHGQQDTTWIILSHINFFMKNGTKSTSTT
jgi:putative heme iron utilization protein